MAVKVLLRVEVSVCQAPLDAGPDLFLMCVIKPVPLTQVCEAPSGRSETLHHLLRDWEKKEVQLFLQCQAFPEGSARDRRPGSAVRAAHSAL